MKLNKFYLFFLFLIFLNGCSNKTVSKEFLLDKKNSLDTIFSKMLYKNKDYPFLYGAYASKNGSLLQNNDFANNFNDKLKMLCKSRNGTVMSVVEFDNKYHILKNDMADRCFRKLNYFNMCVLTQKKKKIPKVIFVWYAYQKEINQYSFDYTHSFVLNGQKYAWIDYTPSRINTKKIVRADETVCLPDQENWTYFFNSARQAYLIKEKEKKLKIQKSKLQKQKENTFRRF